MKREEKIWKILDVFKVFGKERQEAEDMILGLIKDERVRSDKFRNKLNKIRAKLKRDENTNNK